MTKETYLVPAKGKVLQGIRTRERIRELRAEGKSRNQIAGLLDITTGAVDKQLKKIELEEQAERQSA